jgi:hypothetical protein
MDIVNYDIIYLNLILEFVKNFWKFFKDSKLIKVINDIIYTIYTLNNEIIKIENKNGYITDAESDGSDIFHEYEDDITIYSNKYYDEDDLNEKILQENNCNYRINEIDNVINIFNDYKKIGKQENEFHKRMNDHYFHEDDCNECNYDCINNKYICGATIPNMNSVSKKTGKPTQYKKCGYSSKTPENCVHDCNGYIYQEKNSIVRFKNKLLSRGDFKKNYYIEYLDKFNNDSHKNVNYNNFSSYQKYKNYYDNDSW